MSKKKFYKTIVDESCFEIIVGGTIEKEPIFTEECHGTKQIEGGTIVTIESVEVVVAGVGLNIFRQLTKKQIDKIALEVI